MRFRIPGGNPMWYPPFIMLFLGALWALTLPSGLFTDPVSFVLEDRNGELLGAGIAGDDQWRFPELVTVPGKLEMAVLSFEDRRFYLHYGVDPLALVRAAYSNLRAGRTVSGGSTITMQLVRLHRKSRPRVLKEKFVEAVMALRIELRFSKKRILAAYLSHTPYGGNIVGAEAAAWRYFGRSPEDLSWAEAAMLAVLPNNPSGVNLVKQRDALKSRRDSLLVFMHSAAILDRAALSSALDESLPDAIKPLPQLAVHAHQRLKKSYSPDSDIHRVRSTIDRPLQIQVNRILERYREPFAANGVFNAAAIVLDVKSGEALAYFGNFFHPAREQHSSYVDIANAPRSTASVLKPFLYAAMMDKGEILPQQIVPDIPTRMGGYMPENHTKIYLGAVRASDAVVQSLNVPLAKMLQEYGIDRFYTILKELGLQHLFRPASRYGVTLILGGAESTLWDLTGVYASLARSLLPDSPERCLFSPVLVMDGSGLKKDARTMPFSPGAVWLALEAISEVERPDEEGSWKFFMSSKKIAWKTGTSYGYKDAWAIGTSDLYAVGVWAGNADGTGVPFIRGSQAAGPVLFDIFSVLDDGVWFDRPSGMKIVRTCSKSGYPAGPFCEDTRLESIPGSAFPSQACPYCRLVHLDSGKRFQLDASVYPAAEIITEKRFVLPPVMEWYYRRNNIDYTPLPPLHTDMKHSSVKKSASIGFVYPDDNARIYLPVEYGGKPQPLVLEAHHSLDDALLYWYLNDDFIAVTQGMHQCEVLPVPGTHVLTVMDSYGSVNTRKFTVLTR